MLQVRTLSGDYEKLLQQATTQILKLTKEKADLELGQKKLSKKECQKDRRK